MKGSRQIFFFSRHFYYHFLLWYLGFAIGNGTAVALSLWWPEVPWISGPDWQHLWVLLQRLTSDRNIVPQNPSNPNQLPRNGPNDNTVCATFSTKASPVSPGLASSPRTHTKKKNSYLRISSRHCLCVAKQAMAHILISTPVWNCFPLISHTPWLGVATVRFWKDMTASSPWTMCVR